MNSLAGSPSSSPSLPQAAASVSRRGRDLDRLTRSVQFVSLLLVTAALWWAQALLIPLVVSVLISYGLEPVIGRFSSWHVPRAVAVPLLLTLLVAACGGSAYAVRGEATAFVERLATAAQAMAESIQGAQKGPPKTVAKVQEAARELEAAVNKATAKDSAEGVTPVRIEEPTFKWSDWLWQGSHSTAEFAGQIFVVLVLVYYLSASGDLYKRKLVHIMPTLSDKKITVEILGEIDRQIERFLLARAVISLIVGAAVWATFRLMGLDGAGVWGLLSAALFVVPIAGPLLVIGGAAVAAFVQF
jgi:predicted PurR-regulated permease PerM